MSENRVESFARIQQTLHWMATEMLRTKTELNDLYHKVQVGSSGEVRVVSVCIYVVIINYLKTGVYKSWAPSRQ